MILGVIDGYFHRIPESYDHQYYCESNNVLYEFSILKSRSFFDINIPLMDGYGFSYSNQEVLDHKYLIELHGFNGDYLSIKDTQINESPLLPGGLKRHLNKFIKNIAFV